MAVDIGPKIGIDGEAEFRRQIQNINQQLKTLGSESKAVIAAFEGMEDSEEAMGARTGILNRQIEVQEQKLKELTKGLTAAMEKYDYGDAKVQRWAQAVNEASADLTRMRNELARTGNAMEDLGDETGGLTGKLKDLTGIDLGGGLGKALGAGAAVVGVKELAEGLIGLEESTREYRTIMASLEISSQAAGYTAEETAAAYDHLYGVLGDAQTAATTTANLQALGLTQEQLIDITNASIGAWATYGDSIPIDQMAESINLAAQQSEVSSALADAIEWAGGNVEQFKANLEGANSSSERAQLVLDELARLGLVDAGESWRALNGDIVAANDAQNQMEQAMGRLGETIAPAATALLNFGADVIGWLTDKVIYLWDVLSRPPEIDPELMAETNAFIDGSHAMGLNRVPFDGYIAELHKGEMILPAAQAESLRALMTASPSTPETDFSGIAAGMVNGITTAMSGMGGNYRIEIPIVVNGREFSRAIVTDLRTVMRSDPEVTNA